MNLFVTNLLLALAWGALTGTFELGNLLLGFALGFGILLSARRVLPHSTYFSRVPRVVGFLGFYIWELILANMRVARDVITPGTESRPAVVAVPLEARSELEITLLANLVSMTPGSLSIDVSDDRRTLFIHAMFVDDPDAFRHTIKDGLERRLLEVLR